MIKPTAKLHLPASRKKSLRPKSPPLLLCVTNLNTGVGFREIFQSGKGLHGRRSSKSTAVHQWVRGYFMEVNVTDRDVGHWPPCSEDFSDWMQPYIYCTSVLQWYLRVNFNLWRDTACLLSQVHNANVNTGGITVIVCMQVMFLYHWSE